MAFLLLFSIAAYMDGEPWMSGVLAGIGGTLIFQFYYEYYQDNRKDGGL